MNIKWKEYKIGDLCQVGRGSSPRPISDERYFENGDIPWIKVADATASGKYLFETRERINVLGASFSRLLPIGSLIICASGTLGLPIFLGVEGCIHDGWLYTYDYKNLVPEFLYYFLQTQRHYFALVAHGAAIQNINTQIFRNTLIRIPSINEQVNIVHILNSYDDLIENNKRRIKLLEDESRLIYQKWFVHFHFPGHEHVSVINGVPETWDHGSLSNFYDTASGGTPSRTTTDFFTGDIPWVKTQELLDGFITDTEEKITESALKNSAVKLFPEKTVLIAMYGETIGRTAILNIAATSNQACCAIIPKDARANFMHAFLFFRENKKKLINLAIGAAQKNINQHIVRSLPMLMAPAHLMTLFQETLRPVFDQCLNLQCQIEKLKTARDLLLPRLMSGEIQT